MSIEVELKCKANTQTTTAAATTLYVRRILRTASNYRKYNFQIFVDYIN